MKVSMLLAAWFLGLLLCQAYYLFKPASNGLDMWLSRDQQGFVYYSLGRYQTAAQRFEDEHHRALSFYAAENFEAAAAIFKQQHSRDGYFNWGNSLAHLTLYETASEAYQMALLMDPDWPGAKTNLELVLALATKVEPVDSFDGASQGEIGADDLVFDLAGKREEQAEQMAVLDELRADDITKLWLRRLNTQPATFLKRKFAYQLEARSGKDKRALEDE